MSDSNPQPSAWAPLAVALFRVLWLAALVSNIGSWMQTVGAQWLLVHQPNASVLVALVQTANALPYLLFGLIAGVLADTLDRRRLLIAVQVTLSAIGTCLAVLTFAHRMPPALLLLLTFMLGSGAVLGTPAYQSLLPELVPREQLPAASALNSISVNVARAIGPAIAGVLIAQAGVGAVFIANAATSLIYAVVVMTWRPAESATRSTEPFGAALRAGSRYVLNAPVVRRVLFRAAMFLVPASSLWALLPLIAAHRLALGSGGYGLLLGALGVGAIIGAFMLPAVRSRLTVNQMMVLATGAYAVAVAAIALLRDVGPVLVLLVPTGIAWVVVLSNLNTVLQLFLPAWVRGRSLSVYQMVLFGSQAFGALLWGVAAGGIGLTTTMLIAAAVAVLSAATILVWPFIDTTGMDRRPVVYWAEPELHPDVEPAGRQVVVTVTYTVSPDNQSQFLEAMSYVRLSRLRTGAIRWGLYRQADDPQALVETFTVRSWEEHMRQHNERLTATDQAFQDRATELSDPPPRTSHMILEPVR